MLQPGKRGADDGDLTAGEPAAKEQRVSTPPLRFLHDELAVEAAYATSIATSPVSTLHTDVLVLLFAYFSFRPRVHVVSVVCKRWRASALQSIEVLPSFVLQQFVERCPSLTEVSFAPTLLMPLRQLSQRIRALTLNCSGGIGWPEQTLAHATALTSLKLTYCASIMHSDAVTLRLSLLRTLDLTLDPRTVVREFECPMLEALRLCVPGLETRSTLITSILVRCPAQLGCLELDPMDRVMVNALCHAHLSRLHTLRAVGSEDDDDGLYSCFPDLAQLFYKVRDAQLSIPQRQLRFFQPNIASLLACLTLLEVKHVDTSCALPSVWYKAILDYNRLQIRGYWNYDGTTTTDLLLPRLSMLGVFSETSFSALLAAPRHHVTSLLLNTKTPARCTYVGSLEVATFPVLDSLIVGADWDIDAVFDVAEDLVAAAPRITRVKLFDLVLENEVEFQRLRKFLRIMLARNIPRVVIELSPNAEEDYVLAVKQLCKQRRYHWLSLNVNLT